MRVFVLLLASALFAAPARAQTVDENLRAYALYQSDVTALLRADISDAAALDAALERAARHDPGRVTRGWIAYGAITAAQSPQFVTGVRGRVAAAGRAAVLRQLQRDLTYARRRPPGSREATQLVLTALAADAARLAAAGQRFEGMADAGIDAAWATDRSARTERMHGSSAAPPRTLAPELLVRLRTTPLAETPASDAGAFGGARFWDALEGRPSPTPPRLPWAVRAGRQNTFDRMLTLAGIVIAGGETQEHARVTAVMDDVATRQCLELEMLQYRQCASVAHEANDDAYCLARHGLAAPSACFALARAP